MKRDLVILTFAKTGSSEQENVASTLSIPG